MRITCRECGSQSTLDPVTGGAPSCCALCGATLTAEGPDGRAPLDTLRLDATSLATLVRLGESAHAAADHEQPAAAARVPQMSIPFELSRERTVPLEKGRAPQPSIPFELSREEPMPLAVPRAPSPMPAHLAPYRGLPEREQWEGEYIARVRGRYSRRLLLFFMIVVVALVVALVVGGVLQPRRVLEWMTDALRTVRKRF